MKRFRRPILSAIVFFSTACVLSVGYAAWTSLDRNDAASGMSLTSAMMQGVIDDLNDLNSRVSSLTAKSCPSGMTKIADFCIDNTAVTDAAGRDQYKGMQRCVGANKRLCGFQEYKHAWIANPSLICPGGIGRYSTSDIFEESTDRRSVAFDCQNCALSSSDCIGANSISSDSADKSMCCVNP